MKYKNININKMENINKMKNKKINEIGKIKRSLGVFITIFMIVISSTYAVSYNVNNKNYQNKYASIEDLEVDNTDYIIQRDVWDFSLSALGDGTIKGNPDKTKQVKLYSGLNSLSYPLSSNEMYLVFEFLVEDFEKCKNPIFQGPVRVGTSVDNFRCTGQSVFNSLGTKKVHIVKGKDDKGNSRLDISKYTKNNARLLKLEYHYVIKKNKKIIKNNKGSNLKENEIVNEIVTEIVSEKYFCKDNNVMQKTLINGIQNSKKLVKACSSTCNENNGDVICIDKNININQTYITQEDGPGNFKPQDIGKNDIISTTSIVAGVFGVGVLVIGGLFLS